MPDISAIITAHREGAMLGLSLNSFMEAIREAENGGLTVEKLIVLDRANDATRAMLPQSGKSDFIIREVDYGDQGAARNLAVEVCSGEYIAFLDGDDLWSYNWLTKAHQVCLTDSSMIAHPEFNWFFDNSNRILIKADQDGCAYDEEFLRFGNFWDAMCMAPREAYTRYPFCARAVSSGYAYEDWYWNCETVEAGYRHRVVPDTVHFKRRRQMSQTLEAASNNVSVRPNALSRYSYYCSDNDGGG